MTDLSPSEWVDEHVEDLAQLTSQLIRFDTTSVEPGRGDKVRSGEDECQEYIGERLRLMGADVQRVKPDPSRYAVHPMMPSGHHWDGRAMTLAHLPGSAGAGSLILNGHIDVVASGSTRQWTYPPFAGLVEDGCVFGRGASDMKGGIAAMLFGLEALIRTGNAPVGSVWVQIATDEETNGMGTVALTDVQPPAEAAVIPEPSHFDAWVACRGVLYGQLTIRGRAAHAELPQPDWRRGGAVNAISKLEPVLSALRELEREWSSKRHRYLASPTIVPTLVDGGEFIGSIPNTCRLTLDITYLPSDGDERGHGSSVRREVESGLRAALAGKDAWLAASPLEWTWTSDYPPYELVGGERLLAALDVAAAAVGIRIARSGLNAWHDAATLGRVAGIPAISCGPGRPEQAHTVDESISEDDLVSAAKLYAGLIAEFCGTAAIEPSLEAASR